MMKGFLKISKLMGLMLLASGLLFAGCAGPGSEESAVAGGHGGFIIPVTMDMATQTLTIGDGAGMAVGTWEGHQVGVANAAACTGGSLAATCTIRVTNLDPDYYMANTFIALSWCNDCAGDVKFSNADISNGVTVHVSLDQTGAGGEAEVNGAAYCVAEDGVYDGAGYFPPYNYYGCSTVTTKGVYKPVQYLHPDCGSRDVQWDFDSGSGAHHLFYVNIAAQWFPEDVTADDVTSGGRFDFENRTTYYLTANALDDKISGAVNKVWWRLGSHKRSTTLTGYGSGGADFTPNPGRYFALNVLAEAPDRMEKYTGVGYPTVASGFSPYEYYTSFSFIVRYDPNVIKAVALQGKTMAVGGTLVQVGGKDLCNFELNAAHCGANKPAFTGFDSISTSANVGGAAEAFGWLYAYLPIKVQLFSWNGSYNLYQTTYGKDVYAKTAGMWPRHGGHVGLAKVNVDATGGAYSNTVYNPTDAIIPSGTPDPDPEMGLGMFYFKVQPGTSGMGTEIYTSHWSSENGPLINFNANLPAGGFGGGSDDWKAPCIPFTAGFEASQGCDPAQTIVDYWVYKQTESSNQNIHQSGYNVPGGGAYQYWNIHLCVL